MQYVTVLVEDDPLHRQVIAEALGRCRQGNALSVVSCADIDELSAYLHEAGSDSIDILLMDICFEASEMTGIDAVQRYFPAGCGTQVIYLTGHVEYCTSVYQTEHVYFLTKPLVQAELDEALDKAFANLETARRHPLVVRVRNRVVSLNPQKISYIESDRRKVRISVGSEVVETYGSLSDLLQCLPASFVHCHKSFLVNMAFVAELGTDDIRLFSGEHIPVSQRRRKATHKAFLAYVRDL